MVSLDDYLAGEFVEFDRERKEIDRVIERTIKALQALFNPTRGFPYEISLAKTKGQYEWSSAPSTSTIAMISGAIAAAAGKGRNSIVTWIGSQRARNESGPKTTKLSRLRKMA